MKIENTFHRSFFIQKILRFLKLAIAIIIMVAAGIGIQNLGTFTNKKLKAYYLSGETMETSGILRGEKQLVYYLKLTPHFENFEILEFTANGKIIDEGLKEEDFPYFRLSQPITIRYSKAHPSFFEVK